MVYSSNKIDEMNGNSRYDINIRSVIAFREIGLGLSAIEIFCGHMNFPPPMRNATYTEIVQEVQTAYVSTAKDSIRLLLKQDLKSTLQNLTVLLILMLLSMVRGNEEVMPHSMALSLRLNV